MAQHLTQKRRKTMKMMNVIKRWYDGEQTSPLRKINGRLVVVPTTTRRHWTARITRKIIKFYLKYWQWIWTSIFFIVAAALRFI